MYNVVETDHDTEMDVLDCRALVLKISPRLTVSFCFTKFSITLQLFFRSICNIQRDDVQC